MLNKIHFFNKYSGIVYECDDNLWEIFDVEEDKVILQDITHGSLMSIDISKWDEFTSEYEYLQSLSESLQTQLEADFEKKFGPYEDDKVGMTSKEFLSLSKQMDDFVSKWRKSHGV